MKRGAIEKKRTAEHLILKQKMVTHHMTLTWDLERCVGCQIGPLVCPKEAISHADGIIEDGRLQNKPVIDVDIDKCILCGMCEVMCPVNAIEMTLNGQAHTPVHAYEAFPKLVKSVEFDNSLHDHDRCEFIINNCPTEVIHEDNENETLTVDADDCIHCRQCEVASDGAFTVVQSWEGTVNLRRELCVEGCFACADLCPTRALHINDEGELVLADYYCIKCGACVEICPVKAEYKDIDVTMVSQGVTYTRQVSKVANEFELPIWVERWRVKHEPVESGAWVHALERLADDKASMVEIERKRAIKRRELIVALKGGRSRRKAHEDPHLKNALEQ